MSAFFSIENTTIFAQSKKAKIYTIKNSNRAEEWDSWLIKDARNELDVSISMQWHNFDATLTYIDQFKAHTL